MLITTHFIVLVMVVDWQLSSVIVVAFYSVFALIEGGWFLTLLPIMHDDSYMAG